MDGYLVFRKGGVLRIINHVNGQKETKSSLGPKYSVLKCRFFERKEFCLHDSVNVLAINS